MKLLLAIVLAAALAPAAAMGGEYYIYKDPGGGSMVLSNLPAADRPADRAPGSLAVARSYNWTDATAEEIAATEKENRESAHMSALRDLAAQAGRIADEMQRSNEIALAALRLQALRPSTEINQVIVSTPLRLGHSRFGGR